MGSFVKAYSSAISEWDYDFIADPIVLQGIQAHDNFLDYAFIANTPELVIPTTASSKRYENDSGAENNLTGVILDHINKVLLDDDLEIKPCTIEKSTLEAAEKSFYDLLNDNINTNNKVCSCSHKNTNDLFDIVSDLQKYKSNMCTCHVVSTQKKSFGVKTVKDLPARSVRVRSLNMEESEFQHGRSNKQIAVCNEEAILHEMFDNVLSLYDMKRVTQGLSDPSLYMWPTKKGLSRREASEVRNLLSQCMKTLADGNNQNMSKASELLKKIRTRSCVSGDGTQRLAHYFANGLEARLAGGRGLPIHKNHNLKSPNDDLWKAYKLFLTAFPFMETSYFYANQMIMTLAEKQETKTLHVIHFGIMHGLQWPSFIQSLSKRPGGPPKLRITGIDFPQTGFRPDAMVENTKRRLASICANFNVPFEYNGYVRNWETITLEDIKLEKGEVVVVNCLYHFMYLLDDTVVEHSRRDVVLRLIKMMNPDLFVHVIVNGTYNSPFFISRFREAMFHFSTLFDMFDTNLPRENQLRMVFEREIWGREITNILACEGIERVERPETYKQWQLRTIRAGFKQMPLNKDIVKLVRRRLTSCYHKDFSVDEAGYWLLDGWKGRALFGLSSWEPVDKAEKKETTQLLANNKTVFL